jgi:hypothetical protein
MKHKRGKKELSNATRASVIIEMAKPRMAKSARITELKLDPTRIHERPSISIPGTVDKIIPSSDPSGLEKAQISFDDTPNRDGAVRIENTLTDESGCEVRLKKGAHVKVTITRKDPGRHS